MVSIVPVQAFKDNYIWLIVSGERAIVVDPGQAAPVIAYLTQYQLSLEAILITHHHHDHTGGIAQLLAKWPVSVYGSRLSPVTAVNYRVKHNDYIQFADMGLTIQVLETPGHTNDHIVYYIPTIDAVFSGDCLFNGGCGRIFEGTAEQMLDSLDILAQLPSQTRVYSAHEYTLSNLCFAALVEPDSKAIQNRKDQVEMLRAQARPAVGATLAEEKETNPFLRVRQSSVVEAVSRRVGYPCREPVSVFSTLREWKNLI